MFAPTGVLSLFPIQCTWNYLNPSVLITTLCTTFIQKQLCSTTGALPCLLFIALVSSGMWNTCGSSIKVCAQGARQSKKFQTGMQSSMKKNQTFYICTILGRLLFIEVSKHKHHFLSIGLFEALREFFFNSSDSEIKIWPSIFFLTFSTTWMW